MPTGFTFDAYRIKNERLLEEYRSPFSRLFETFLQFLVRQLRNNGFSIRSKIRLLAGEKRSEQVVHLFTRQDLSRTDSSRFCQRKCQRVTDLLMYFATGKKFNPMIGVAGVSCVPTTAKVVQKIASAANPSAIILPQALGANISGVITSAIIAGVYITLLR